MDSDCSNSLDILVVKLGRNKRSFATAWAPASKRHGFAWYKAVARLCRFSQNFDYTREGGNLSFVSLQQRGFGSGGDSFELRDSACCVEL